MKTAHLRAVNMRVLPRSHVDRRLKIFWIYAIIATYFYAMPLFRITTVEVTDFRLYDLMLFAVLLFLILPNLSYFAQETASFPWMKTYLLFCLWCGFSLLLVLLTRGFNLALVALARLFRFTGYGLVHIVILLHVKERKHLVGLTWFFFGLCAFEAILSILQFYNFVPQLWPRYWVLNYGDIPAGTLGLHHMHLGTVMVMGIAIGLALMRDYHNWLVRAMIALVMAAMIYATFAVSSRTGWFGIVVVGLLLVLDRERVRNLSVLVFLLVGIWAFIQLAGEHVTDTATGIFQMRVLTGYQTGGIGGVDTSRVDIWNRFLPAVLKNPWVLLTGAGIQNISLVVKRTAAMHNNYMQVVIETGLIGLILYLQMCYRIWKQAGVIRKNTDNHFGKSLAICFQYFFIALLSMNLFNENFYMQYASFSLTGQIMAFAALALHPAWLTEKENAVECREPWTSRTLRSRNFKMRSLKSF